MIEAIIRASVANRFLVLMLAGLLAVVLLAAAHPVHRVGGPGGTVRVPGAARHRLSRRVDLLLCRERGRVGESSSRDGWPNLSMGKSAEKGSGKL